LTREPRPASRDFALEPELAKLRALAAKLVPARDVDDVVQETVARALRYRDTFDGERELGPWLAKTALRVALDLRARRARVATVEIESEPAAAIEAASARVPDHGAPDRIAEERELVARLLSKLSKVERDVLVRFHQHGESVREIASALGLAEGTVKSHLHRARRRLAEEQP
jgi:RNA polymerase sigma-70 factor (ECF subfamily)